MHEARTGRWALWAILAVVATASACGGSGTRGDGAARTEVSASSRRHASAPASEPIASKVAAPAAGPAAAAPTTTSTGPPRLPATAAPAPTAAPTVVSIVALSDATFTQNDQRPCSNLSAQTLGRGQLEVRRTGSIAADLVVSYGATGADGDHEALPGRITIPAGAASAVIPVDPHVGDVSAPRHDHHSSTLSVSVLGGLGYMPGPAASAAIAVRFDVDVYGCDQRVPEGAAGGTGPVS
jgi:hypothetical protein